VFREGRYTKSRHGVLRILRRHIPDSLGTGRGWMQQQERTGQHTKKQHDFSRSNKPFNPTVQCPAGADPAPYW
jgi:hypothetical protein